jgi:anti-anti-sigma factor
MTPQQAGLCGDVDHFTAGAFRDGLFLSIDQSNTSIVGIDLAGVTFMDSAGYRAVVDANAYAVRTEHQLVVRNLSASCTKLIWLCDQRNELLLENDAPAPETAPALDAVA